MFRLSNKFKLSEKEKKTARDRMIASVGMHYIVYFSPRYSRKDGRTPMELTPDEIVHEVLKEENEYDVKLYDYFRFIEAFNNEEISDLGYVSEFCLPREYY